MMTKRRLLGEGSRRKDFDEEWYFTSEMEKKVSCKHDMNEDKWKDLLEWELHQKSKYRTSSRKNVLMQAVLAVSVTWTTGELADIIFSNPREKGRPKTQSKTRPRNGPKKRKNER